MAGGTVTEGRGRWRLSPRASALRTHPVVLASLAVLVVNDHLLKQVWPGPVTGLASDVAGLILLPVAIVLFLDAVRAEPLSARTVAWTSAAVAAGFAAVELLPIADAAYEIGLGLAGWPVRAAFGGGGLRVAATPDPWDLVALPFAATAWYLWSRPVLLTRRVALGPVVVAVLAPALLATSPEAPPKAEATKALASTAVVLDAGHPQASFLVDVGTTSPGASLSLTADVPDDAGQPPVLVTASLTETLPLPPPDDELLAGDAEVNPGSSAPLRLGSCREACTRQARVVVELEDPGSGRWESSISVTATATAPGPDSAQPKVTVDVHPDPSPPPSDLDRIVALGTLRGAPPPVAADAPAMVVRVTAKDQATLQRAKVAALPRGENTGYIATLHQDAERDDTWEPLLADPEATCAPDRPCELAAALLPEWPNEAGVDITVVRTGPTADGLTLELLDAVWTRHAFKPKTDSETPTVDVAIEPGDTLYAALRRPTDEPTQPVDQLRMDVTDEAGEAIPVPEQPSLARVRTCPADAASDCTVTFTLGSTGLGWIELDVLTVAG